MPLNENAKISDIITSLGNMQGINQKAELASVIGTPATSDDNIATQITKIQDAKDVFAEKMGVANTTPLQSMAKSLVVGKKWASGTVTSSSLNIVINDLPFNPSVLVWYRSGKEAAGMYFNFQDISFLFRKTTGNNTVSYLTSPQVTYQNGTLTVNVGESNNEFNWVAYE